MASATGRREVSAYIAGIEDKLLKRVLVGAARAGGKVVAEEAGLRTNSKEVRDAIIVRVKSEDQRVVVRVTVKEGWAFSRALWEEYGTSPHFISVDDSQREGRGIQRINTQLREADNDTSLVIGGKFVGKTVFHPGAQPNPFLRPAIDIKQRDALQAAQSHINSRVTRRGIVSSDEGEAE